MPLYIILERIFLGLVIGTMVGIWKLLTAIFSALAQTAERTRSQREAENAFGKLDHEIEIYDPDRSGQDAD